MTDLIESDDAAVKSTSGASSGRRPASWGRAVLAFLVGSLLAGGVAWWLQEARVEAREAARAEAAAQLEKTLGLLKASEATAAAAAEQLKQAKAAVETATRQASEATAQVDVVRRDAAGARAERDQAKAALASARSDLDRVRSSDADPGLLPTMELAKLFGAIRQVRTASVVQLNGGSAALDQAAVDAALVGSLSEAGLAAGSQSPFQVRLLVTVGQESTDHSVGLLLLVTRTFKVPGEAGSREVSVWGQQLTSHASDAQLLTQVQVMTKRLCAELGAAIGAKPAPPASTPSVTTAPASPSPNAPKP